ncbi:hypothetical protein [Streptomyces sp. NPDC086777]|uniref:hypothetical protein n=1 Tax=Streptomyces sp. NPDC086777 TaxID=3154866 RepID=UPI00344B47B3
MVPPEDFFSVISQVIPALLVVVIVEQALFLGPVGQAASSDPAVQVRHRRMLRVTAAGLAIGTLGEASALLAVAYGGTLWAAVLVWISLSALALVIGFPVAERLWRDYRALPGTGWWNSIERVLVPLLAGGATLLGAAAMVFAHKY